MKKLPGCAIGLLVIVSAAGLVWDRYLNVSIKPATEADIRAAVPAGLLPAAPDPMARSRFDRLVKITELMHRRYHGGTAYSREDISNLNDNVPRAIGAMGLVREGPLQAPGDAEFSKWPAVKTLARDLALTASLAGKTGDSTVCEQSIQDGLDYAEAIRKARGPIIGYLVSAGVDGIAIKNAADCIRSRCLKPADLRKLIGGTKEHGVDDEELKEAYRQELSAALFDKITGLMAICKALRDPRKQDDSNTTAGNFDALETAGVFAKVYGQWIVNAGRPWNAQDNSESKRVSDLENSLPKNPSTPYLYGDQWPDADQKPPGAFEKLKYRMQMNATPNSWPANIYGGLTDLGIMSRSTSIKASCMRELLRGLAAIWAYKEEHGVKYPDSLGQLVADGYLKQLPTDRFSQKPLLYNSRTHVIYSVGESMKDLGGDMRQDVAEARGNFGFAAHPRSSQS